MRSARPPSQSRCPSNGVAPSLEASVTTTWNDGYVTDVPYTEPMISDLCPAWLSMISVLNGQPPLDPKRQLVWADLGCGSGLSACMVAATNPNIKVWGFDFNPAH